MTVDPAGATAAEGPGARATASAAPQTVGKYRLERVIGSGGMGQVWAAFDPDLERAVAVKLLHAESNEPALRTRLLREARAMARLRHPNVVTVFDVGTDQNRDYIAMELIDGGTLADWLETKPARPAILDALIAAGKGLAAAHAAGLVHRDFKPHNVLRARDGHVYVTDFGLARGQIEDSGELVQVALPVGELTTGSEPRRARDAVLDSPLTQTGVLIGTPAYMAPEQFRGRVPDPKSDQFAFCVTAWEALTGTRPFRGATLEELETAAAAGARDLPAAELPAPLRQVLVRGLDPSPDARWPDMTALLAALGALGARPAAKRRWIVVAAAAAIVAGGSLVTVLALRGGAASADPCVPPEEAFARVWGPAQQDAFTARHHGPETIGAIALITDARREWIKAYSAACAAPRTPEIRDRIACLLGVRDDATRAVTRLLQPGASLDFGGLAMLAMSFESCAPEHERGRPPHLPGIPAPPAPPPPDE